LDYLCELPTDAARRKALESLPPDLHKTYERILNRVSQSDQTVQRLVQRTLQWIVCSHAPLLTAALCEAIAVEEGDKYLDKESICGEDEILLHCSSLIRRSADGKCLELAHFTVKEFLSGIDPNSKFPLGMYSLQQDDMRRRLARTCLTYLNLLDFQADMPDDIKTWNDQREKYPFRDHAARFWLPYARQGFDDPSLLTLTKDLFRPSKTLNFLSWIRDYVTLEFSTYQKFDGLEFRDITTSFCTEGVTPLHIAAALGCVELCEWLITSGCDVSQMSRLGHPLHCALRGIEALLREADVPSCYHSVYLDKATIDVVRILIDAGADYEALYRYQDGSSSSCFMLALSVYVEQGVDHPISILSKAGASVAKDFLTALKAFIETYNREQAIEFVDTLIERTLGYESKEDLLKLRLELRSPTVSDQQKKKGDVAVTLSSEELGDSFRRAIKFDQRAAMEELLLDNRLDPNSASSYSNGTALHVAAESGSADAIELLLSLDADVCAVDLKGQTPLHRSAYSTNGNCTSLLLDCGADADAIDDEGCTVWHLAAGAGNVEALGVLLKRVDGKDSALALSSKSGLVPIIYAAEANSSAALMLLLPYTSQTPLSPEGLGLAHYGVQMNSVQVLQALLEKGAPLDGRTKDGSSALHFIWEDVGPDVVRLLTTAGVGPTSTTSDGDTPLHTLLRNHVSVYNEVIELLATRDSVNMVNRDGFTALHYAVNFQADDGFESLAILRVIQYLKTLIANGADLAVRDPSGRSCLQILLDQFAQASQPENRDDIHNLAVLITEVMGRVTDTGMLQETSHGSTPLAWAFMERKETLLKKLVAEGINVDLPDKERNRSALDHACYYGCSRELLRQMLQSSQQLDEPNGDGDYLPHIMCRLESTTDSFLLQELLEAGANPDSCLASGGRTPMMLAACHGKLDHLQVLLKMAQTPTPGIHRA
jgi:ankyrin repeat protein